MSISKLTDWLTQFFMEQHIFPQHYCGREKFMRLLKKTPLRNKGSAVWFMSKTKARWHKISAFFHTETLKFVQSDDLDHWDSFELHVLLGKQQSAPAYHQVFNIIKKTDTSHTSNQSKSSLLVSQKQTQLAWRHKSRSYQPMVCKTMAYTLKKKCSLSASIWFHEEPSTFNLNVFHFHSL